MLFFYKVRLNFSIKVKYGEGRPLMTATDVAGSAPDRLSKRIILSKINGLYDPLGLSSAFTIRAKILWRNLWMGESKFKEWDEAIPCIYHAEWVDFCTEMFLMENVRFKRCIQPVDATSEMPMLVVFSDASVDAFGACAYARWKLMVGTFSSRLIAAKSRVSPVKQISIVHQELNGAL